MVWLFRRRRKIKVYVLKFLHYLFRVERFKRISFLSKYFFSSEKTLKIIMKSNILNYHVNYLQHKLSYLYQICEIDNHYC
jgi:hypothetical protein